MTGLSVSYACQTRLPSVFRFDRWKQESGLVTQVVLKTVEESISNGSGNSKPYFFTQMSLATGLQRRFLQMADVLKHVEKQLATQHNLVFI